MALPTGTISLSQVNSELGRSPTQSINLNDTAVRSLAGKASGAISMNDLRGKSAVQPLAASASPSYLSGYGYGSSYASTDSTTCTASGGAGGYAYTWEQVSAPSVGRIVVGNANAASTSFILTDAYNASGQTITSSWRCKVVSGGVTVYSNTVTLNFQM